MKKSVLIIGAGIFGQGVIEGLYERGHDIFVIDKSEEALENVRHMIVSGAIFDVAENDDELTRLVGEKNFDDAVVAMGEDFEGAIMATQVLKEAGIRVSVKAANERRGNVLAKIGADRVIFPERDTGRRLAALISHASLVDVFEFPQGFVVQQMEVGSGFAGQTIAELNLSNRFNVWILLIYQNGNSFTPKADFRLNQRDRILIFGNKDDLARLEKENT
jgi:trk system potassium uptake protein TrkA